MKMQNSSNKPLVVTVVVLAAIILCGGAYLLFFKDKGGDGDSSSGSGNATNTDDSTISAPVVPDINKTEDTTTVTKDTLLGKLECVEDKKSAESSYCKIENSKIRNARSGVTYTLTELTKEDSLASDFEKLAKVTIDEKDAKLVTVKLDKEVVKRYYNNDGYDFTITITFDREVSSSKIAGFGQGVGDEYIFFLMKDNTLDVLSVAKMLKDRNFDPQILKGVSDVTAVLGGSSYNDKTGGHTNFAVRSDQTAYDLETMMPSWGTEQ